MRQYDEWAANSQFDPPPGKKWNGAGHDEEPRARRFRFIHADDLKPKPITWLVRDYLEAGATTIIFGEPESMKTFLVMDIALHLASGRDWHGRRVERQHTVAYVCGEGERGIGRRVEGWCQHHHTARADLAFFASNMPTNLSDDASRRELIEALASDLRDQRPELVVIDTMARNLGAEENDNTVINEMFAMIDGTIRASHPCAVILVGHPGHQDKMRVRGGAALIGNTDADARVERGAGLLTTYYPGKMKDAPKPSAMVFEASELVVELEGEDGEPETGTTLVLDYRPHITPATKSGRPQKPGGQNQTGALRVLERLYGDRRKVLADGGRDASEAAVEVADWRAACDTAGIPRNRFAEVSEGLEKRGLIRFEWPHVYPVGA